MLQRAGSQDAHSPALGREAQVRAAHRKARLRRGGIISSS